MNKIYLITACIALFLTGTSALKSQTLESNENSSYLYPTPKKSLRLIFEATFQKERQTGNGYQENFGGIFNNGQNSFSSTNPYDNQSQLGNSYNYSYLGNYSAGSSIRFGFDANFTNKNGRKFVISNRTTFTSNKNIGYSDKETWFILRSEGPKPSSIAIDFAIKVIR